MDFITPNAPSVFKSALVFRRLHKGRIKISLDVLQRMMSFIQDDPTKTEAGGVLLGRFILDCEDVVVDKITIPMIGDKRERFAFKRSAYQHQRIVDNEWEQSQQTCHYLGEWHTHPEKYPTPSSKDKKEWLRKLRENKGTTRELFFIIIGTREIVIWEGDTQNDTLQKLTSWKN